MRAGPFILVFLACLAAGCATSPRRVVPGDDSATAGTTRPTDPRAELTLAQIAPDSVPLPATQPSTRPASTQPSLDALDAYARGRAALAERQYYTAINLLEKAQQLDPESAQVHYQLADAYAQAGQSVRARSTLLKALALRPDWIDALLDLGQIDSRADPEQAVRTLAVATRTNAYATDDAAAAVVDYHLSRLLAQLGYDGAAIDQYEKLLWRLSRRSLALRGRHVLANLAVRPDPIETDLARLYERRGRLGQAVALYQKIADRSPDAFEPQARVVRVMLAQGRAAEAIARARALLKRFHASGPSVELMREVVQASGGKVDLLDELRTLHEADRADSGVLMAYVEALSSAGRSGDAERLMADLAIASGDNLDLLRRVVALHAGRNDTLSAARVLIEVTARRPAATTEIAPLWQPLIRPWRIGALRAEDLRKIPLPPESEPARLYWMARLASETNRDAAAVRALRDATDGGPVFGPAYLLRTQQVWTADTIEQAEKQATTDDLARRARDAGDEKLALSIEAVAAGYSRKSPEELPLFGAAVDAPGADIPEFLLAHAAAYERASDRARFEQICWKVISDFPRSDDAYRVLIQHHLNQRSFAAALKVLNTWLANDPQSVPARILQARLAGSLPDGSPHAAELMLLDMIKQDPQEPQTLAALHTLYMQGGRPQLTVDLCEQLVAQDGLNGAAIDLLQFIYNERGDLAASVRVLEAAERAAAQTSPDMLYYLAQHYYRMDEKRKCESMMEQALRLDPGHVPSSNDLAYFWCERGENLARSEQLARQAVAAEPDNAAYLDTLGWALYKQGRFDEAATYLHRAAAVQPLNDAVVLDHLGDVLYRQGDDNGAAVQWRRAIELLQRAGGDAQENANLRLQIANKLRQREEGEPVEVAPAAEARAGE